MLVPLSLLCAVMQLGSCLTERPIIGIVTVDLEKSLQGPYPGYDSYIAASYVKAIEGSGARVVPVFMGRDESYYRKIIESVNGILIPGGGAPFNGTNNYYATSKYLYHLAMELNEKGVYFPVFGVCLGFEILLHFANDDRQCRRKCDIHHVNLSLDFSPDSGEGNLFKSLPNSIARTLQTDVTVNNHIWCIYPDEFNELNLGKDWRILSTTTYENTAPFISSVEHRKHPVFGVQFHPEKNIYEWHSRFNFPRSADAIAASRYFYDWFVEQSKMNDNHFADQREEEESLIYNFAPAYSQQFATTSFTQAYLFKSRCPGLGVSARL